MNDLNEYVRLARDGSSDAFAKLYATVYKEMYHIALYNLRNSHDAGDVVSDAVLDAFCSIGKLKNADAFKGWIMKILYAKIKKRQREYFAPTDELDDDIPLSDDFQYDDVELKEALGRLDNESRLILSMSVLGGYSSSEISQMCDLKPSSVRSRIARIKEKLRMELTAE